MLRKVGSVIVGFVLWSVLWVGLGTAAGSLAPETFPSNGAIQSLAALLLFLGLSVVCSLLSGGLASRMGRAIGPVLVLGILLLAVGIMIQTQYWSVLPVWYHLTFLVLLVPATLIGGYTALPRS